MTESIEQLKSHRDALLAQRNALRIVVDTIKEQLSNIKKEGIDLNASHGLAIPNSEGGVVEEAPVHLTPEQKFVKDIQDYLAETKSAVNNFCETTSNALIKSVQQHIEAAKAFCAEH